MDKTRKIRKTSKKDPFSKTKLYPPLKPLSESFLKAGDYHNVAYWTYGNPKGKPAIFIHGGPGGGTNPNCARFFDPKAYFIVLVDQRGCGKSTPIAELRENTTQHLIEDFEKIRNILGVKKWMLFGGSWGSTLCLAYAIAHPEVVTELVIRGVFLIRKSEVEWFIQPRGTQSIYPDTWKVLLDGIPKSEMKADQTKMDFVKIYGKCFRGEFGAAAKNKALLMWSTWESSVSHLHPQPVEEIMRDYQKSGDHIAMSTIEQHYFENGGFFGNDNYFLEKKNLDRIRHIPLTIVQGRYDVLCPMISANDLYKELPHAKFHATIAGHSGFETENIAKLVEATNIYKKRS